MGITVNGEGRVSAAPDTLTLGVGVDLQRDGVARATDDAGRLAAGIIAALQRAGVDASDIQTSHHSIQPVYDRHRDGPRLIGEGWRVGGGRRTFFTEGRMIDGTGRLVATATGAFQVRPWEGS